MVAFDLRIDEIDFSGPAFDHFLNDPRGEIGQHLKPRAVAIKLAAERQVGVDTAKLLKSIYMIHERVGAYQQFRIGSDNEIALIHHEGSRPHEIAAREPNVIRFSSKGRVVYTHSVMHPGTRANRYLSDNLSLAYV